MINIDDVDDQDGPLEALVGGRHDICFILSQKEAPHLAHLIIVNAQDSMRYVRTRAELKGVKLSTGIKAESAFIIADERRMKQILINLLTNAVKFTPQGGDVALRVWTAENGGQVFSVTDTSVGMTQADILKAMEPFSQVRRGEIAEHEGAGLGLTLTMELTELHGGTLAIASTINVGTTVTAHFPPERSNLDYGKQAHA